MNMNGIEDYDLVVLGSGAGEKVAAWMLGGRGEEVAVIERKYIGGPCPNIACLPGPARRRRRRSSRTGGARR